ncbi:MAG: adenylate/guanylate cyclase domain-containing protein [Pseudomonadota bacterium]
MATTPCVVFFADLADSVHLYDTVGDATAREHVQAVQRLLGERIAAFDGNVHQIVGDELMVCFADADRALACSVALHHDAQQYSHAHGARLQLRIGMHYGEVITDTTENRLFGDTVNLASRVNGIAQAEQTILTEALLQRASPTWLTSVRQFDETRVKGKTELLKVFDLPWQTEELTTIVTARTDVPQPVDGHRLMLHYRGRDHDLSGLIGAFSIGRALTNDLVVTAESVSRRHVTIERVRDHFVLSDKSTNGTHLLTHEGNTMYLRREQWPMSGHGSLALGAPPDQNADHTLRFHCGVMEPS